MKASQSTCIVRSKPSTSPFVSPQPPTHPDLDDFGHTKLSKDSFSKTLQSSRHKNLNENLSSSSQSEAELFVVPRASSEPKEATQHFNFKKFLGIQNLFGNQAFQDEINRTQLEQSQKFLLSSLEEPFAGVIQHQIQTDSKESSQNRHLTELSLFLQDNLCVAVSQHKIEQRGPIRRSRNASRVDLHSETEMQFVDGTLTL